MPVGAYPASHCERSAPYWSRAVSPQRGAREKRVKFFCEQCKAKYQIPDEKVAGKTL